ncbi:ABC transporter ATP-binding protein [Protaetiibacter mangrovi]|uniref:Energy-coupling factor ABC transporter ATP-binding protein n=1 Tax=Protaetiibacter mangrovi TaxID=2970926 RepID=A0ABT1ZEA7_9MICO|nr:ABC transporter ATP-binding protein [Protaetiibacter mangrovi]MCS0499038.1 energy-coupling factor ABC transporter ATP-binding protein [Protaetiibacter mangrovi]TPW92033.1 ABC transporter ATP-binding protein [Schumannella luteola]
METAETGARGARVEARGWGWRHAGRRDPAVSGLDLVIEPGERVLLLGASGAGKSTLLHGLAGILGGAEEGEQTGALLLDGSPAATVRGAAGLVLQDPDTQAVLARLGDDVAFGLENQGVAPDEIRRRVPEALTAVGLGELPLDHSTTALSGGQKQRLALAGVLAMRPSLLLLDEPTANLDPEGVSEVVDAVVAAAGPRTLVVVEHRVEAWWPHITRVVVLAPEGVIADGSPDAVVAAARAELEEAGVWLPGAADAVPARPAGAPGPALLRGTHLAVGRAGRTRRDIRRGRPATPEQLAAAAARDVEVEVRAGRVLALTGPNGAGKTTLALTIAGLIPPVAGEVDASVELADGATRDPAAWRSRELLTRIGFVFQSPDHQFLTPTVRQELELGPHALGMNQEATARVVDELLERLRLARLARAHPFSLSGGEKRRLSVATVLATSPRVLVLDEPTFGQDARTWRELVALLAEQRDAGRAVVVVTHDRALVRALDADELTLDAPRIVRDGGFREREATISHDSPRRIDGVAS